MFKKGDVVVGLPSASGNYTITRGGTQWIVYDTEFNNILVGKVVTIDRYKAYQKEYDEKGDKDLARHLVDGFWVEAKHFKFVYALCRETNEDSLDLLIDDAMSFLIPKEMVK